MKPYSLGSRVCSIICSDCPIWWPRIEFLREDDIFIIFAEKVALRRYFELLISKE